MSRGHALFISLCAGLALMFLGLNAAQASLTNLLVNGDAETLTAGMPTLDPWIADETQATGTGQIGPDDFHNQSGNDVNPFEGDYFFSFAKTQTNNISGGGAMLFMRQTGTDGLDAPILHLSGQVHTNIIEGFVSDVGEAFLRVFDSGDNELGFASSGPKESSGWIPFDVTLDISGSAFADAAYWMVELKGTKNHTKYTNVFWDAVALEAVPIPSTLLLFGTGLFALVGIRRRFKG